MHTPFCHVYGLMAGTCKQGRPCCKHSHRGVEFCFFIKMSRWPNSLSCQTQCHSLHDWLSYTCNDQMGRPCNGNAWLVVIHMQWSNGTAMQWEWQFNSSMKRINLSYLAIQSFYVQGCQQFIQFQWCTGKITEGFCEKFVCSVVMGAKPGNQM